MPKQPPRKVTPKKVTRRKTAATHKPDPGELSGALAAALGERALVRVSRNILRSDKLDGFVVGLGTRWMLLALLDHSMFLDGYVALRLADVKRVQVRGGPDTFAGRALALRGEWPPAMPGRVDLDRLSGLLRTLGTRFPLVALYNEVDHPDECVIGHLAEVTSRSVALLVITPEATWHERPTKWPLSAVTRVDVGDHYEAALSAVGGPAPSVGGGKR